MKVKSAKEKINTTENLLENLLIKHDIKMPQKEKDAKVKKLIKTNSFNKFKN